MTTLHTVSFQKTVLASLIGLCLSQSIFALENLEQLDDAALSQATGEGIAMLPENFRMVFQGANDDTTQQLTDYTNRAKDTGYIRYIPVGPLTAEATASGAQKADLFLYGLAISRADSDINNRYNSSTTGQITSWGSADNPWLLKVQTVTVPNFAGASSALSYLSYEAPTYDIAGFSDATKDDYHLKLGLWADAFMRDPKVAAPDNNPSGWSNGLSNRLRLQAIWNDFSINGSSIRLFQTLGGATNTGGLSTSYNNTLGLAGMLRFNGGDTRAASGFKATITDGTVSRTTANQAIYLYSPTAASRAPAAWADNTCQDVMQCYQLRTIRNTDTYTGVQFTLPTSMSVLRFSTRGAAGEDTSTPAIGGGVAPTFAANEGMFMYGVNMNLVLGQLYQPLTLGVAPDGRNLSMELARVPNQQAIYSKLYTRYAADSAYAGRPNAVPDSGITYTGSTCNAYQCSATATHSSISIGSTVYSGTATNLLTAYTEADAIGVSFGALNSTATTNITQNSYQLQYKYRQKNNGTTPRWTYLEADGTYTNGTTSTTGTSWNEFTNADWINAPAVDYSTFSINPQTSHTAYKVEGRTDASDFCTGSVAPSATCAGAAWGPLAGAMVSGTTWSSNGAPATPVSTREFLAPGNLGSAVIDGFFIQHMKLTTKGL